MPSPVRPALLCSALPSAAFYCCIGFRKALSFVQPSHPVPPIPGSYGIVKLLTELEAVLSYTVILSTICIQDSRSGVQNCALFSLRDSLLVNQRPDLSCLAEAELAYGSRGLDQESRG